MSARTEVDLWHTAAVLLVIVLGLGIGLHLGEEVNALRPEIEAMGEGQYDPLPPPPSMPAGEQIPVIESDALFAPPLRYAEVESPAPYKAPSAEFAKPLPRSEWTRINFNLAKTHDPTTPETVAWLEDIFALHNQQRAESGLPPHSKEEFVQTVKASYGMRVDDPDRECYYFVYWTK